MHKNDAYVILSLSVLFGFSASAQIPVEVSPSLHRDVSRPLREIGESKEVGEKREIIKHRLPPKPPKANNPDPVLQASQVGSLAPAVANNFDGIGQGAYGFTVHSAPPDTNGAAGDTQFVQWVNTSFAVFDKATGALVFGPSLGSSIWAGFGGGCETNNDGDPILEYDKAAQRWIFSQFSVSTTPYLQCFAVSTTSDATGSYYRYSFPMPDFPDYPKIGVWPDAYYASFNMFSGNTFTGARACAFDRQKMLTGSDASSVCFQLGPNYSSLLPSDLDGSMPPPTGTPNYFLSYDINALLLWKFHADFATPANSTFTGPSSIPMAPFAEACNAGTCILQLGTTQQLDSLGDRLMYRLAYRNFGDHEALVVNHSVTAGSSVGVRWYELRSPGSTPAIFQQGTYAPDLNYRWLGSIAMDKAGDIAMGYSVSGSSLNPSIRFTGRVPTEPLGTMEAETTIVNGTGSQLAGLERWGDYSSITIDPVDDCTFWYTSEYLKSNGTFNWSTRIANFKFAQCGSPDFLISASPPAQTVIQSVGASYSLTVTPSGGFNGTVSYSVTGLPAGVGASFNPNPSAAGSVLSVTTSSTTPSGSYTLTVRGVSGSLSHTASVTLLVNPPTPTPPTTDSVTPNTGSGASQSFTFKYSSVNGYNYLNAMYALINGNVSTAGGCVSYYVPAAKALYLFNDAGSGVTGPLTLGAGGSLSNSQCTINGTGSSAIGAGNTLSVTLALVFNASYKGTQTLFGYAADNAGLSSGWQTLGTWITGTVVNSPPTADSVTPSAGSGASQTFTFKYSSVNGSNYLNVLYSLITGSLSVPSGCVTYYVAASKVLYLFNDAGTAATGPLTLGAAGSLSNSQCTINGTGSSAIGAGNSLSITLVVVFNPSFKGTQTLFGYAADNGSLNSGWKTLGTWSTGTIINLPPTTDSVTPNAGSGANQNFAFKYSSVNGNNYLTLVYALINGSISATGGCVSYYLPASKALYLYNDAGSAVMGPLTLGTAGSLSNSQCTINGTGSAAVGSGNTLTLTLTVAFNSSFKGSQTLFGYAADNGNLNSGWQTLGTWTTGAVINSPPTADSVTPNAGSGTSQNFTVKYSSVNGYSYLNSMYALINGGLSVDGGCVAYFVPASKTLYLYNDSGSAATGPLTLGTAGSLSNSQCTISGPASSAVGSGNTLSLTLAVVFSSSFHGAQTVYGYAADGGNLNSGWQTLGTWTTP